MAEETQKQLRPLYYPPHMKAWVEPDAVRVRTSTGVTTDTRFLRVTGEIEYGLHLGPVPGIGGQIGLSGHVFDHTFETPCLKVAGCTFKLILTIRFVAGDVGIGVDVNELSAGTIGAEGSLKGYLIGGGAEIQSCLFNKIGASFQGDLYAGGAGVTLGAGVNVEKILQGEFHRAIDKLKVKYIEGFGAGVSGEVIDCESIDCD